MLHSQITVQFAYIFFYVAGRTSSMTNPSQKEDYLMATTWIKPIHTNKGWSKPQSIAATVDYVIDPAKTQNGKDVTGYGCTPENATEEFMFSKDEYAIITGREQGDSDILVYHVRQAFRPGEVTPEMANQLGHELAMELTKGENGFIVATHTDRNHVHNHIIINSTRLDCMGKYRNPLRSSKQLRKISDAICERNGLSIVEDPGHGSGPYSKYKEGKTPTLRQKLESLIEEILQTRTPKDFDHFLEILDAVNCKIKKRGKTISLLLDGHERAVRFKSLSEEYSEANLRERIAQLQPQTVIQSLSIQDRITAINIRMKEIESLQKHVNAYRKTEAIVKAYHKSGRNKNFFSQNAAAIKVYQSAKAHFDNIGLKFLPSIKDLQDEYSALRTEKQHVQQEMSLMQAKQTDVDRS